MVLPEGLGGVLAAEALQDLCAAGVVVLELCTRLVSHALHAKDHGVGRRTGQVVDAIFDDDPQVGCVLVLGDFGGGEGLGHGGRKETIGRGVDELSNKWMKQDEKIRVDGNVQ